MVVKFYRAARWSDAQILEEHAFALELAAAGDAGRGAAAAGRRDAAPASTASGWRRFPCAPGAAPELDAAGARELLGRTLARIHAVGVRRRFLHRLSLERDQLGERSRRALLRSALLPEHMQQRYAEVSAQLVGKIAEAFAQVAAGS